MNNMNKIRPLFCFGILIILLNVSPSIFDTGENISNFHNLTGWQDSQMELKKELPRDLPWPPFKGDSSYRRILVELDGLPTSLKRTDLRHSGLSGEELGKRVTEYYRSLIISHELFKNRLRLLTTDCEVMWDYYNAYNGIGLIIPESYVSGLQDLPGVKSVGYDKLGQGALSGSVKLINADDVWQLTNSTGSKLTGEGVVIAVLDTGIDYNHKDLGSGIGPAYKIIGGYDFVNKDTDPFDDNYHGTMVTGIIAANGSVKGVAPNASILAYKVSDETDNAWITDTLAGLDRALDPDGIPATNDAADIICISLSWFGTSYDEISKAVDNAFSAGSLPVVAGGNNGPDLMTMRSPGGAYGALTLGASTKADKPADISSRGPVGFAHIKPDIVAPGIDIFTTYPGNSYGYLTGTSAAGPHAVGAAALLKQLHPNWTASELKDALINNARDIGADPVTQGAGRLDVLASVTAKLSASPGVLAFESESGGVLDSTSSETLTLNNSHSSQVDGTLEISCYYSADLELVEFDSPVQVFNYLQPSSSSFSIPALSTENVVFNLNIPATAGQGYYWGRIEIKSAHDNLTVPFGFRYIEISTNKGEWLVSTDTQVVGQQLRASNLTVTNSAKLTLDNVTLFIDSKEDGLSLIDVKAGSSITITNSILAAYNPSIYYNFSIYGPAIINRSSISGLWGIYESPYPGGINIYSDGSEITNSTIFRCYTNGVFSALTSDVLIADNYIHHNGGEGVLVWMAENIRIYRNNCSRNWWDGVGITGGSGVIAENSIHYNSYDGIWINNSSPYISRNFVSQSGYWMKHDDAAGIKFQRGSEPIMEKNVFADNKYYGFYINASSPVVWNTSIFGSSEKDVYILPFSGNHCAPLFINTTYNTISIPHDDTGSSITRQWFLRVNVKDEAGQPVPGAAVKLVDKYEALVGEFVTDYSGFTELIVATQYIRTLTKTDYMTPYRLEINKSIIKTAVNDIFLPANKEIKAVLAIPDLEIVNIKHLPSLGYANETVTFSIIIFNNASFDLENIRLRCTLNANTLPSAEFNYNTFTAKTEKNITFNLIIRQPGSHKLHVHLSTIDNIIERNYSNNYRTYNFSLQIRPAAVHLKIVQTHTFVHEPVTFVADGFAGEENITGYQFRFSDGRQTAWLESNSTTQVFSNLSYIQASFRILTGSGSLSNWSEPLWFLVIPRLYFSGFMFTPEHGDILSTFTFEFTDELKAIESLLSSYRWTFGDGGFSDEAKPSHGYSDDGSYNASLSITYATDGGTAIFWKTLVVNNLGPEAKFFTSSKTVSLGESITFNASTTTDQDDPHTALRFIWQFGDDNESEGRVVEHTYTAANTYLVILTVIDDDNVSSLQTMEVTVIDTSKTIDGNEAGGINDLLVAVIIIVILALILVGSLAMLFWKRSQKKLEQDLEDDSGLEE